MRRAAYGVIKFVMENGAKGVEVVVAGKIRGQRAKAMKFREGYMVKSGQSAREYNDYATRHIMMRQGIMGCRVKIMQPHDVSSAAAVLHPVLAVWRIGVGRIIHPPTHSPPRPPTLTHYHHPLLSSLCSPRVSWV